MEETLDGAQAIIDFAERRNPKLTAHEQSIKERLERRGYKVMKNGLPDFLVRKGNRMFFVECKSKGTRLTPDQTEVKECLESCGLRVVVAHGDPSDDFCSDQLLRGVQPNETKRRIRESLPSGDSKSAPVAYSAAEFAKLFHRSKVWAYRRIWAGDIKLLNIGGRMMIPAHEVTRLLGECDTYAPERSAA